DRGKWRGAGERVRGSGRGGSERRGGRDRGRRARPAPAAPRRGDPPRPPAPSRPPPARRAPRHAPHHSRPENVNPPRPRPAPGLPGPGSWANSAVCKPRKKECGSRCTGGTWTYLFRPAQKIRVARNISTPGTPNATLGPYLSSRIGINNEAKSEPILILQ